jgi:hypothetical protein
MRKLFLLIAVLSLPLLLSGRTQGVDTTEKQTLFQYLKQNGIQNVELEGDLTALTSDKRSVESTPIVLRFTDKNKRKVSLNLKASLRGRFRRRICEFPPLKLDFPKGELKEQGLKKNDEYKLVTHCRVNDNDDEYLLREYLVYQLYQILTEKSYQTHLLRIQYKDTGSGQKFRRYAVLIEDDKALEKRLKGDICSDCYNYPDSLLIRQDVKVNELFQFMIGNSDWSPIMLRNVRLLQLKKGAGAFFVPYDFDFSGVVNAPYAIPAPDLGITNCRQRVFLGSATSREELLPAIEHFRAKKEELFRYVNSFKNLRATSRKDVIAYLQSFYDCLDHECDFIHEIVDYPFDPLKK